MSLVESQLRRSLELSTPPDDDEPVVLAPPEPVCKVCNDTHVMPRSGYMCGHCPLPCQKCRQGGTGAYCTTTPCGCECHRKDDDEHVRLAPPGPGTFDAIQPDFETWLADLPVDIAATIDVILDRVADHIRGCLLLEWPYLLSVSSTSGNGAHLWFCSLSVCGREKTIDAPTLTELLAKVPTLRQWGEGVVAGRRRGMLEEVGDRR